MLSLVSTWMGDRLGIPGAVDLLFSFGIRGAQTDTPSGEKQKRYSVLWNFTLEQA